MGAIFCTSNPVILENGGAVLASQGKSTHCQFMTNHQEISQPLNGVKKRSKMKTCNGCKYLYIGDDGFNHLEWWCKYYDKGVIICDIDGGDTLMEVQIPDWCPLEEEEGG